MTDLTHATASELIQIWEQEKRIKAMKDEKTEFTPGPWAVQKLNHVAGDLWLQIGLATGFGPIAGITGDDTAEPTFKPVAGMKYLVTPEAEQWANARLIAAAPALYEALVTLLDTETNLGGVSAITLLDAVDKARAALALVEEKQ